ncbi:lytic transglycosylase domain-containing protein [Psychrobacter phenylpyruvicus]|uniref:Soluble lytic murein transglycosylase n=1 Tax=Psychrobacter phenylpyruvicus TaxID=29432 RepID=A0A379LK10_9GAMM|nr:Soluble lytic murein transglycosylase precursor [Psychrobacter phenylpyruvicus]
MLKKTFTNKLPKKPNTKTKARGFGVKVPVVASLALMGLTQMACAQLSWPGSSPNYSNDTSINYFNEALAAAERRDSGALYQYEQMMGNGLFAMYPAYWRLNNDISTLHPNVVTQFASQYSGSVMAEKLAADYAETKAQSGDYNAVRQVANYVHNADDSEKCAVALGFNNGGDAMRAIALKPDVWLTTKKQPALCSQLATEMNGNPMINNTDRKQRLLRMLRVGNTGDIMALAQSLGTPIAYSELSEIQLNPSAFLTRFGNQPNSVKNQYLYLYAIGRIADKSYREAAIQVDYDIKQDNNRPQKLINEETRRYAYRILGVKRMYYNTDDGFNDEAITWFRNSLGESFNYEEAEDYATAAIRFSQWNDLINAIGSMDNAVQKENIWQYWLARAYEQVGDGNKKALARQIYQRLANNSDYYGLLAKDKVNQRFNAGSTALPNVASSDTNRMLNDPHFARAFALYNSSASRTYANREWNWAVKKARDNNDNKMIVAASKYAHDIGWLDRSIYAIDSTEDLNIYSLSHPMPHQDQVVRYSRQVGIDPAWAYGIMRQESRFVSTARSGVGASGLMQIMPDTAKYIARNLGETYSASRANSGDTNIRYGTWYMSDIMGKLYNQPVLATAGYNAGPNKAKRWQPVYGSLAADQYVESIAYPETRNYVKRVMENATIYSSLLGANMPITQRMGTIPAGY